MVLCNKIHSSRMMHICSNLTIIGSDNGILPVWHQAIIWTNAATLSIRSSETYLSAISSKIQKFSFQGNAFEKVIWKMAAILSRPQCVNSIAMTNVTFTPWAHKLTPHINVTDDQRVSIVRTSGKTGLLSATWLQYLSICNWCKCGPIFALN